MPLLKASSDARLINVSSIYGIVSPPGQAAYSASKFAVRGFSNALRHELAGSNVGVTAGTIRAASPPRSRRMPAAPEGATNEEVEQGLERARRMPTTPPPKAGEIIVDAVERRAARVLVGNDAKFIALLERLAPVSYWKFIEKVLVRS